MKFQKDADVVVMMNGECKLNTADIEQAAGRGNRSQGQPKATVIMTKRMTVGC